MQKLAPHRKDQPTHSILDTLQPLIPAAEGCDEKYLAHLLRMAVDETRLAAFHLAKDETDVFGRPLSLTTCSAVTD